MTLAWVLALGGALGVALVVLFTLWHDRAAEPGKRLATAGAGWIALLGSLVLFDLSVPQLVNSYVWQIIIKVGIYVTLAVSLNIINGIAGQFSMGHAGFMAVGGYTAAYLTMMLGSQVQGWMRWLPWNGPWAAFAGSLAALPQGLSNGIVFLIALLAGGLAAAIAGYLVGIPSLRLRGDYLAIVTLGFGEIIRNLIANVDVIGASRGLPGVPHYSNLFWVFSIAALVIFVSYRLLASAPGRAMLAVREDEVAAAAMGINTTRTKIQAFAIGTFFAGIAGALLGHQFEYLHPDYFKFDKSFEVIIMVVLGGMGSVSGAAVAAVVIAIAPEALRYAKDLLGNLTEPAVLYAAVPFILFALLFLALFTADVLRLIVRGAVRMASALRVRAGGAPHADIARLRSRPMRRWTMLIPDAFTGRPPALRDAGLGGVTGLLLAILHRGLLGGGAFNPRIEYWVVTLAGMAVGVLIGSRARGHTATPAAGSGSAPGTGAAAPVLGYRRLAAVGVLAPAAFLTAHALESWAPDFLMRMSTVFRNFPDPRMVLYSMMLVALMLTRPTGLFGSSEIRTWWREKRGRAGAGA
jgi:branched-chain amino acid transport system permease protein